MKPLKPHVLWILGTAIALGSFSACQSAPTSPRYAPSALSRSISGAEEIDPKQFELELKDRISRIPEFKAIQDWARKKGVRVWLAGGSATGIASYLREELQASAEDVKKRFPYNSYYDIYRSTQDADVVLDADEHVATELEEFLRTELGHLQGSKSVWEVRLLRKPRGQGIGKKDPIIGDANFRNQNSDSYSLALVEITDPPKKERRVRDAFFWDEKGETPFFRDLLDGKVTYYRNPAHHQTSRAVAGWNPEIISVIRAFSKSYQYDAEPRPESLETMKKVIAEFNPTASMDSQAVRYVLGNAGKIFQHSRDLEATWNALENSGLRAKLIRFAQTHGDPALATLLDREPIRSYPLGQAPGTSQSKSAANFGKTASQLNIDGQIFSHETNSFLAYENITMSRDGKPNFFISRSGRPEEAAVYGDGVYARLGRQGARGTGLTIRFELNPDAVCGRDFYQAAGDYYVFLNANAIRIVPEDRISLSISQFMEILDQGNFSTIDRGVLKKLELKMVSNALLLSDEEVLAFYAEVGAKLKKAITGQTGMPASLELFMRMAKTEPRLKDLFAADIVLDPSIGPAKRLSILAQYGLADGVFAPKIAQADLWEALKIQTNAVLRHPLSPEKIRIWQRTFGDASQQNARGAQEIFQMALAKTEAEHLPLARKQFAAVGMEDAVDARIFAVLKANQAGASAEALFAVFNETAMKLPSLPADYHELALRNDNPARDLWAILIAQQGKTPQDSLDALIAIEKSATRANKTLVSNWWALIVGYYEKAHASNPGAAAVSMKGLLQRQRGTSRFAEIALELIKRPEFLEYVGEQAVAKLETAPVFGEKKETAAKYFAVLNAYLDQKDEVPRKFRKWANHSGNPMRARWKEPEKTVERSKLGALQHLCDRYDAKTSIDVWRPQWRSAFADAVRESPEKARAASLDALQAMRGATFQSFAAELAQHGMGEDAAILAIAKLATHDLLAKLPGGDIGKLGKAPYYDAVNRYLATLSTLPKPYEKYALAADNPQKDAWKKLPLGGSARNLCVQVLKRAF